MPKYVVYATRYDDPHIIEEIPARNLEFSLPLSDHGTATFSAQVEPGGSLWRDAISLPLSGVLIARDDVPVWQGWVTDERLDGLRSFQFTCKEWGAFFAQVPAVARTWSNVNDHKIFRDLITDAQAVSGQNVQVQVDSTTSGSAFSDRVVNWWDDTTVEREFRSVSTAIGGPEWYFHTTGTIDNPVRRLVLGDRLGLTSDDDDIPVLEYVEDTEDYASPDAPPMVALLGELYPGLAPIVPTRRAGGNLIAHNRTRSTTTCATVSQAWGSGQDASRLFRGAQADDLLTAGWPRLTRSVVYPDVVIATTLQEHAQDDLDLSAGIATGYSLIALDDDPDWTQTPRGSSVRVVLDTDIYGAERPVGGPFGFDARLLGHTIRVSDSGPAQVEWQIATVEELASQMSSDTPLRRRTWSGTPWVPPRTWRPS
jgi:hypothetical protein